jgi:palmitoyltransferase ZDHHC6
MHFIYFLLFAVLGCLHAAVILSCSLYAGVYRDYYIFYQEYKKATVKLSTLSLILTVFNIGLAVGVVIAVGMLLFFQLKSVFLNRTGIEDWILDKAIFRRKAMARIAEENGHKGFEVEEFKYPYDLGLWRNITQVLNLSCVPIGDGINWPVIEGCDQYTLTVRCQGFVLQLINCRPLIFLARATWTEGGEESENEAISNCVASDWKLASTMVCGLENLHTSAFD